MARNSLMRLSLPMYTSYLLCLSPEQCFLRHKPGFSVTWTVQGGSFITHCNGSALLSHEEQPQGYCTQISCEDMGHHHWRYTFFSMKVNHLNCDIHHHRKFGRKWCLSSVCQKLRFLTKNKTTTQFVHRLKTNDPFWYSDIQYYRWSKHK